MNKKRFLLAAFTFTLLLLMKHIFLYFAPAFFVFLLKHYCNKPKFSTWNFGKLGIVVASTAGVIMIPFLKHIPQLLTRLFPFGRGLTHAY